MGIEAKNILKIGLIGMTKTHAELLPCPHCGFKAEYRGIDEHYQIWCPCCCCKSALFMTREKSINAWNKRTNKEAEFLEWVAAALVDSSYICQDILDKIEQFQAEQKQVSDANNE